MEPKKIKILYVITQGEWGGAQRYVFDLATNLGAEYEIMVAVGEQTGRHDLQTKIQNTNKKIQIISVKHLIRNISPYHDFLAVFELTKLYRQLKPDIVHLNSSKAGIIGSLTKLFHTSYPPRLIYTAHGWVFDEPLAAWRQALYRWLEKWTAKYKDKIIVLSQHDYNRAEATGIPKEKIHIIDHGIDTKELPVDEDWNQYVKKTADAGKKLFITIGNLYQTKGIDVLIKASHAARNRLAQAFFVILGEGKERKNLENLIKEYNLEKTIALVGWKENTPGILKIVAKFDGVFVLPSRKEGLPYVLLEAKQARIPIIATRVGGVPELIEDKKSGLLVKPDSVNELSEALVFAVQNPNEMKRYAEGAPTPPPLSGMISKTTSLYSLALDRP